MSVAKKHGYKGEDKKGVNAMTTFRNTNHYITPKRTYKGGTWNYQHTMGYKRQTTYLKGEEYFTKDFEKKEWAEKYLSYEWNRFSHRAILGSVDKGASGA